MASKHLLLPLIAAAGLALGGCVAGIAAGALGAAVQGAQGQPQSNAHLRPQAVEACTAQAAPHGAVHIIDVEQRAIDRMIVWGTVDDGGERRSFECRFTTRIVGFQLRPIAQRR
jgi:hypothetical protein